MKKFTSLLLSIVMLLSITAGLDFSAYALSTSGECGDNVSWSYNTSTGTLTISGTGGMYSYGYSNSPFCKNANIKTVIIEDGITDIGNYAFCDCSSLNNVKLPNTVTYIGRVAFSGCETLTNITIPNTVTEIGDSAFSGCSSLTKFIIPDSLTSLGQSIFRNCTALKEIEFGKSIDYISTLAFDGCTSLESIVIPSTIKSIGQWAFSNCTNLKNISISNSVEEIGDGAFQFCSLETISIPSSVKELGEYLFIGCQSLKSIIVDNKNSNYSSLNGILYSKDKTKLISYPCAKADEVYTSLDSVKEIENSAFDNCDNLKKIICGNNVELVGANAIYNCSNLESVYILNSKCYMDYRCVYYNWDTVIIGHANSTAQSYADEMGMDFVDIEKNDCDNGNHYYHLYEYQLATCITNGYNKYKCVFCDVTKTESIDKTDHNYKTTTTKATTSKNGSKVTKCTICDNVKSKSTIYYPKTITLSATAYTYDGKAKKPTVTVKDSNAKTISSSNYTVTYASGCKNVGSYTVKITFKGNYSGNVTKTFTINPKNTTISSVTAKSKGFTVKWKKYTTQTTGYQIQYSTSSKFKNAKTVTVSKNSTTSNTISKLKGKKKYYVRIRTYKKVGKTNYYSSWSKTKTVTTKK
jgi:hypothetical protein